MKGDASPALPHLRAAATVAPQAPINLFFFAQCLLSIEAESHEAKADELFQRPLRFAPVKDLDEKIKNQQRRLADWVMHANALVQPDMDTQATLKTALVQFSISADIPLKAPLYARRNRHSVGPPFPSAALPH